MTLTAKVLQKANKGDGSRPSIRNYVRERNPFIRSESSPFTSYVDLIPVDEDFPLPPQQLPTDIIKPISSVNLRHKSSVAPSKKPATVNSSIPERQSTQVLDALKDLSEGENLEKFLQKHGLNTRGVQIIKLKEALKVLLNDKQGPKVKEIPKWERRLSQMSQVHEFRDSRRLSKWMESVGGTTDDHVDVPKIQEELRKYFDTQNPKLKQPLVQDIPEPVWGVKLVKDKPPRDAEALEKPKVKPPSSKKEAAEVKKEPLEDVIISKTLKPVPLAIPKDKPKPRVKRYASASKLEDFKGRSLFMQEETMANKIWRDFKDMSAPKQVAVVVGITVATAALGAVSWRLLALTFPSAFSMNGYWGEVLAQWFMQRQESTYNLLMHTAENSKPLSTAWANQYILWKYI